MSSSQNQLIMSLVGSSFAPEHLAALSRVTNIHKRFLERIKESYLREQSGYERIFFLDFQEIYSYAYPYQNKHSRDNELDLVSAIYLLRETKKTKFVLPFGTRLELENHLANLSSHLEDGLYDVNKNLPHFEDLSSASERTKKDVLRFFDSFTKSSFGAERILRFLDNDNVFLPLDIGLSQGIDLTRYQDTFDAIQHELKIRRPNARAQNNWADAFNLTWTIASRNSGVKVHPYLVTHTDTLLRAQPRIQDEFHRKYGYRTDLTWTPATAVYSSVIDELDTENKVDWINRAITVCQDLSTVLDPLLVESERKSRGSFSEDVSFLVNLESDNLNQVNTSLKPFYEYAVLPFAKTFSKLEEIWRTDLLFELDKNLEGANPKDETQDEAVYNLLSINNLANAKERIFDLKFRIEHLRKNPTFRIALQDITLEDLGYKTTQEIVSEHLETYAVKKAARGSSASVIKIDFNTDQGYIAVTWPVALPIKVILKFLQKELANTDLYEPTFGAEDPYQDGIFTYSFTVGDEGVKTSRRVFSSSSLSQYEERLDELKGHQISFLRINTLVGDFLCYTNLVDGIRETIDKSTSANRVTVFTHKKELVDVVCNLFEKTSFFDEMGKRNLSLEKLREFIREKFHGFKYRSN